MAFTAFDHGIGSLGNLRPQLYPRSLLCDGKKYLNITQTIYGQKKPAFHYVASMYDIKYVKLCEGIYTQE